MTQNDNRSTGTGLALHERAVLAGLDLLERRQTQIPQLEEVADALGLRHDDLQRLFPDGTALMQAAAESALVHLMDRCTRAVVRVDPHDAMGQFVTLGEAYLAWAAEFPQQYRLLSEGRVVDLLTIPKLRRYSDAVHSLMVQMLERGRDSGQLHAREDVVLLAITARTFAHGLARMIIDGRMSEWHPDEDPLIVGHRALHDFIRRMARSSMPQCSLEADCPA